MSDKYFYYASLQEQPVEVNVVIENDQVIITNLIGESITTWHFSQVVSVDEERKTLTLWLANNEYPGTRLIVKGQEACARIWMRLLENPKPRQANWGLRFAIAIPSLAALFLLFAFFGPSMNSVILASIPPSFDKSLGDWAVDAISQDWEFCTNPKAHAALEKIVNKLEVASGGGFDYRVRVVRDYDVNAMAAPGGNIVVLSGLLESAETPEEVAGILAHEMAHVTERHGTAMITKEIFLSLLFTIAGRDRHGIGHDIVAAHMTRDQERDADFKGSLYLNRAGISVSGLRTFFERLARKDAESKVLSFLHSHPDSSERALALKDAPGFQPQPLLTKKEWKSLKNYCANSERQAQEDQTGDTEDSEQAQIKQ